VNIKSPDRQDMILFVDRHPAEGYQIAAEVPTCAVVSRRRRTQRFPPAAIGRPGGRAPIARAGCVGSVALPA
jgi:hypothetical protein